MHLWFYGLVVLGGHYLVPASTGDQLVVAPLGGDEGICGLALCGGRRHLTLRDCYPGSN